MSCPATRIFRRVGKVACDKAAGHVTHDPVHRALLADREDVRWEVALWKDSR